MFDALIWTHQLFILYISSSHPNASWEGTWKLLKQYQTTPPKGTYFVLSILHKNSKPSQTWRLEDDGPTRSWVQRLDRRLIKDSAFRGCRLFSEATQCDLQLRVAPPQKVRRAPHLHQPKRPRFATERACAHVQLYIRSQLQVIRKNPGGWAMQAWSCRTCIASQAFWPWKCLVGLFYVGKRQVFMSGVLLAGLFANKSWVFWRGKCRYNPGWKHSKTHMTIENHEFFRR